MKALQGQQFIFGEFTSVPYMLSIILQIAPSKSRHSAKVSLPSSQLLYILTAWGNRGDQPKPYWSKNGSILKRPHNLWEYRHFHSICIWSLWCLLLFEWLCRWLQACLCCSESQALSSCDLSFSGFAAMVSTFASFVMSIIVCSFVYSPYLEGETSKRKKRVTSAMNNSLHGTHVSGILALLCDAEKTLQRIPSAMR